MLPAPPSHSRLPTALLAAALLFAAIFPTLRGIEFSRTLENLNVATALEARRGGHWLQPTLEGLPRTVKPPLLAWITALSMSPQTVAACSSHDPATRDAAFHHLALQARWPALVMTCLTVLAVYALGATLGDPQLGAVASLIAAGSYGILRYSQVAITDVPLTLWVTVAHAGFCAAVFGRRWWGGMLFTGAAVGLAFMSKGPAALVQTVLPWLAWAAWRRTPWGDRPVRADPPRHRAAAIAAAILLGLLIAIPWYLAVLLRNPAGQWHTWWSEMSGDVAAPDRGEPLVAYLGLIWELLFPWVLFLGGGLWLATLDLTARPRPIPDEHADRRPRFALLLITLLITIVILSFRREKKDRYLLPMIGPMSVIAARCALAYFAGRTPSARRDWFGGIQWGLITVFALGLPIVGLTRIPAHFDGVPAYTVPYAATAIAITLALLSVGFWGFLTRRSRVEMFATVAAMLLVGHVFSHGYRNTESGLSDMKPIADAVWAAYPDAETFTTQPLGIRAATDFSIYMNRPTSWTTLDDVSRATPGPRPKVVLIRQREREPAPAPPAPWTPFQSLHKGDGSTWHAFVLPAANA